MSPDERVRDYHCDYCGKCVVEQKGDSVMVLCLNNDHPKVYKICCDCTLKIIDHMKGAK